MIQNFQYYTKEAPSIILLDCASHNLFQNHPENEIFKKISAIKNDFILTGDIVHSQSLEDIYENIKTTSATICAGFEYERQKYLFVHNIQGTYDNLLKEIAFFIHIRRTTNVQTFFNITKDNSYGKYNRKYADNSFNTVDYYLRDIACSMVYTGWDEMKKDEEMMKKLEDITSMDLAYVVLYKGMECLESDLQSVIKERLKTSAGLSWEHVANLLIILTVLSKEDNTRRFSNFDLITLHLWIDHIKEEVLFNLTHSSKDIKSSSDVKKDKMQKYVYLISNLKKLGAKRFKEDLKIIECLLPGGSLCQMCGRWATSDMCGNCAKKL
jgi:hypothetical protein